ncbi:MAG: hypothetical protein M5U09_25470 [Gammaproteobacteria bacterium]|nr:hypothetical protein [Gammaproteobacteria bacterium]
MLRALPSSSRLLAIEIDPHFASLLREEVRDPRLTVECASAADIGPLLARHRLPAPESVVSGIPFSTMPMRIGQGDTARGARLAGLGRALRRIPVPRPRRGAGARDPRRAGGGRGTAERAADARLLLAQGTRLSRGRTPTGRHQGITLPSTLTGRPGSAGVSASTSLYGPAALAAGDSASPR